MRPSNLQFQGYWDLVLSIDFTYQYCGVFGVSVLRTPRISKDSRNANQNTYVCILHKLVRTYTLNYPRDLFLSIRQREKVADWGCGYNLVLDFVFGACQHSLSRLYLPICVSHQPYDMIVGDNHVNMIYCRCYCNTNICILFHPHRDTGGVNCISCLLPTSVSVQCEELDIFRDHATFRVASPRYMWGFLSREKKIVCIFPIWSHSNSLVKVILQSWLDVN